jgi:hypothetical protein
MLSIFLMAITATGALAASSPAALPGVLADFRGAKIFVSHVASVFDQFLIKV